MLMLIKNIVLIHIWHIVHPLAEVKTDREVVKVEQVYALMLRFLVFVIIHNPSLTSHDKDRCRHFTDDDR